MQIGRFVFTDMIGKLISAAIIFMIDTERHYFLGSMVYLGILAINHGLHNEQKSLFKLIPTFFIGLILNFILLVFFMAPVFSNTYGVISLAI